MSLSKMSVLYVEDQEDTQDIVSHILKREVKELFIANNGEEGLNLFKEKSPDIVITDIMMPILDGISMIKKIKEIKFNQVIIVLTAFSDMQILRQCVDLGIERFINKPVLDLDKLIHPLKTVSKYLNSEKTIKNYENRFKKIFQSVNLGILRLSLSGEILEVNKKFCEIVKYTKEELEGLNFKDLTFEEDLDISINSLNQILDNTKNEYEIEKRYIRKDKKEIWVNANVSIVEDIYGDAEYLVAVIEDISIKKQNEVELKQAMTVFQNTHDGIIITDENCNIINVNKAFEETTGYKKEEVLNKNPNILKSEIHSKHFYEHLWKNVNENGFWTGEITNKKKNGSLYEELLTINAIIHNERIVNYIGVFTDLTLQKEQEKILIQQSRTAALGEMISNIAHQWRQPLSVISTASTGMKLLLELDDNYDKKEFIDNLDSINNQTQHLSNTIDDFRDFFKDNSINSSNFDLKHTFKKIKNLVIDAFRGNFIEIIDDIDDDIILHQNENLLIQAMINIFNNSKDAFNEKDVDNRVFYIKVRKDDKIRISLKDNAGGINQDFFHQIFEPYFTTKHSSIGTGLGLYMTYKIIIKQFNGNIIASNVDVEYNNKKYTGAQFEIILPLSS